MIKAFLGCSVNGFISPSKRTPARFTNLEYMKELHKRLAEFDIKLMTGATLRAYGTSIGGGHQVIWTRNYKSINPDIPFFNQQSIKQRTMLSPDIQPAVPRPWDSQMFFTGDWDFLRKYNKVAVLGGAALIDELIRAKMLSHLELVISGELFNPQTAAVLVNSAHSDVHLKPINCQIIGAIDVLINYQIVYS